MSDSTTPNARPEPVGTLQSRLDRDLCQSRVAGYRHRLVTAAGIDPVELSEQGQRILRWLTEWDDWTIGGLEEILQATRTAAHRSAFAERAIRSTRARHDVEREVPGLG